MGARGSREFEGLLVATDDWPVLLMEFPERRITDAALQDAIQFIEELLLLAKRLGEKTYQVTDLSRVHELAPASQRKYVGEWMKRSAPLQRAASLGGALVTPSAILRGLVSAFHWFKQVPVPSVFVATRREAFAAGVKAFDESGQAPLGCARATAGALSGSRVRDLVCASITGRGDSRDRPGS